MDTLIAVVLAAMVYVLLCVKIGLGMAEARCRKHLSAGMLLGGLGGAPALVLWWIFEPSPPDKAAYQLMVESELRRLRQPSQPSSVLGAKLMR